MIQQVFFSAIWKQKFFNKNKSCYEIRQDWVFGFAAIHCSNMAEKRLAAKKYITQKKGMYSMKIESYMFHELI